MSTFKKSKPKSAITSSRKPDGPPPERLRPPVFSDADPATYPDETRKRDADGLFNFYIPIDEEDQTYMTWMYKLGDALGMGTFDPRDNRLPPTYYYELTELPKGYKLFRQVKQPDPDGPKHTGLDLKIEVIRKDAEYELDARGDPYLYGHPIGTKYRSTLEFIPHLLWLENDPYHNYENCACCLCPRLVEAGIRLPSDLKGSHIHSLRRKRKNPDEPKSKATGSSRKSSGGPSAKSSGGPSGGQSAKSSGGPLRGQSAK
ncbi:hypothetical protein BC938DRAFT_471187, partial [Jimgerdemannia flammicorona]